MKNNHLYVQPARLALLTLLTLTLTMGGCREKSSSENKQTQTAAQPSTAPAFNADSAYTYVAQQVAFGPRVPNTAAHQKGGDYLVAKLKQFGFQVTEQKFTATTWDGQKLNARNIIGSFNPQAAKRVLLAAHWDSRPHADQDSAAANKQKAVLAANDGASGAAVLLELARTIQAAQTKPNVGVDIVFFDAEDWGDGEKVKNDTKDGLTLNGQPIDFMGFCLGSRYWAKNPHKPGYQAYYGILLDMVGAKGATFLREGYSQALAPSVVSNIWQTASRIGYSQYFVDQDGGAITDDHIAPNLMAKIPMIDIIHTNANTGGFFPEWHTAEDDLDTIDKGTLKAVGQTLTQVLYDES